MLITSKYLAFVVAVIATVVAVGSGAADNCYINDSGIFDIGNFVFNN